jgi:hypothetical protein
MCAARPLGTVRVDREDKAAELEEATLPKGARVPDREHFWALKPGLHKKIPIGNCLLISRLMLL